MADIDLEVKFKPTGKPIYGMRIDRRSVRLQSEEEGRVTISDKNPDGTDKLNHSFSVFLSGSKGAALGFEVYQGDFKLAEGKAAISYGHAEAVVPGQFKHRVV